MFLFKSNGDEVNTSDCDFRSNGDEGMPSADMKIRPLKPELALKAKEEINERPERIKEDLKHIKEWLSKQPHIKARTDDQWLIAHLRGCKYSLERMKEKFDLAYTMRSLVPDLFRFNIRDPKFVELFETGFYLPLPKPNKPDGPLICLMRPGCYDPEVFSCEDAMNVVNTIMIMLINDNDNIAVSGLAIILDLKNVTMGHFLQMTPALMKKMVLISQDSSPIRQKGNHYLNTPPGFETIFNFIKNLLSSKNQQRLFVHNKDMDSLYKHIPKDLLPNEYGGVVGTIEEIKDHCMKKLIEYEKWFEDEKQFGSDESKRRGPAKTAEHLFGVEGSFRQLIID